MNNKPIANSHPEYDHLVGFATNSGSIDPQVAHHVSSCEFCQKEIASIKQLISNLKAMQPVAENFNILNSHISDQQINDYAYNKLNAAEKDIVESHLQQCVSCKKEVLLLQTAIMQTNLKRVKNNNVKSLPRKPAVYRFSQFVSLSAAASVLLAIVAYLVIGVSKFLPDSITDEANLTAGITTLTPGNTQDVAIDAANAMQVSFSNKGYKTVKNGTIDWYNGYVETVAVGTVDMSKMINPVQAEIIAEKSARATAYAQIAEILGGVQITQSSTYNDLLLKVDSLVVESNSFIRNAQVIESKIEWLKEVPKATVKMRVPLYGNYSIESIVTPHIEKTSKQQALQAAYNNEQWSNAGLSQYTGVVVDARNTAYQPALLLSLRSGNEETTGNIDALQNIQVAYYPSIQTTSKSKGVGNNPYIVTAAPTSQKGEIIVDAEALKELISILTHTQSTEQMAVLY